MKKHILFLLVSMLTCSFNVYSNDDAMNMKKSISFSKDSETIFYGKEASIDLNFSHKQLKSQNYELILSKDGIVDVEYDNARIKVKGINVGETVLTVRSKDGSLSASCKLNVSIRSVKKWLAFGNSITKHGITDFWWGEWGMAATVKEKDYVHVLNGLLEEKYNNTIDFEPVNIAPWEGDSKTFDKEQINKYLDGTEDVVVIRIGENVGGNTLAAYKEELSALVKYMKSRSPNACYVITGNFWTNKAKDEVQKAVAEEYGCLWLTLDQFDTDENKCTLDTKVFGDDGKWHVISEGGETAPGVAAHPSDIGMENIAKSIFSVLTEGEL